MLVLSPSSIAARNVQSFVQLVRNQIDVLIPSSNWDEDVWPVGTSFQTKGQNRDNRILAYCNLQAEFTNRQTVVGEMLHPDFIDFAKAYCRYSHSVNPVAFENLRRRLIALQLIEAAFRSFEILPRIENCNVNVMNEAVRLAAESDVGQARYYQFAMSIQQVHRFCMDRRFFNGPFQWRHGVKKPAGPNEEVGDAARKRRNQKMPSPQVFDALGHVYVNSVTSIDRIYSSLMAIFVFVPIRAHEALALRDDCEVTVFERSGSGAPEERYGLRVWPGKGNVPQVKWVPSVAVSIVRDAVKRIRDTCAEARQVAKWYENNPEKLWLPANLEHLRKGDWIPIADVQRMVGYDKLGPLAWWIRQHNIEWRSGGGASNYLKEVRISSLESEVLRRIPTDFPDYNHDKSQKYSETLVVLFYNEGHAKRGAYRSMIAKATVGSLGHWLSGHDNGKKPSVFERWDFVESDGSAIDVTSHAFRHWLATVGASRGMSELDIAKWSGRDPSQNVFYDHETDQEVYQRFLDLVEGAQYRGALFAAAEKITVNSPISKEEFLRARIGSAHTTESGVCIHDFSLLPCARYGNCLGCSENVFVKGDPPHIAKIEKQIVLFQAQLDDALAAMGEKFEGADRWVASHEAAIELMRKILAIHHDVNIPDGTLINMEEESPDSELEMALRDRNGRARLFETRKKSVENTKAHANEGPSVSDILAAMWKD